MNHSTYASSIFVPNPLKELEDYVKLLYNINKLIEEEIS